MAISNYSELQSEVADFMARSDISTKATTCIQLAEAKLNRELNPVETDTELTGTVDSRRIDISALALVAPIALFIEIDGDELQLTPKADGTFPYDDTSGEPKFYALDGTNIDFDRPLDQAYTFRFRYRQRFALSDAAPTNWLLVNHPDVYLAASILWGSIYVKSMPEGQVWKSILDEGLPEVRSIIAQSKRAVATYDAGLSVRHRYYDGMTLE
jgi:hypothetical protein